MMSLSDEDAQLHPQPQFARDGWTDLRGPWSFAYDDDGRGLDERWHERDDVFTHQITVPFPPESPASGVRQTGYHPVVWYRRTFHSPLLKDGQSLVLHFGAVDYRARVWVNGQVVAVHEGGHTPFSADITAALRSGDVQVLVVCADDMPTDLAQPRGKQDWEIEPHAIWYYRTTGIWQPVWLEAVAPDHIAAIRWTPDPDRLTLGLAVTLQRSTATPLRLRVQLALRDLPLADDTFTVFGGEAERQIVVQSTHGGIPLGPDRLQWSPEHPNLIDAALTLFDGDEVIDTVHSYAGLRSAATGNGRFLLNGRPYYLRLALEQGYWPQSHLAAPGTAALRREVELAKELGFNGVRIHQKVEDPRFLYYCDRLGLLVWGEMANAFVFSHTAVERLTREWLDVLARDYSHPCIVAWVPLNESWGVPHLHQNAQEQHYVQALYHLTKTLDPTRPVVGNDGWEHVVTDIVSIHDYAFDGALLRERYGRPEDLDRTLQTVQPSNRRIVLAGFRRSDEPIMLTEFGGISYRPAAGEEWFGYGTVTSADAYLARYRDLVDAVLDSPVISGFCYTQLTDTGQETNGLLTEDREHKLDAGAIRAIMSRAAASMDADVNRQSMERQHD